MGFNSVFKGLRASPDNSMETVRQPRRPPAESSGSRIEPMIYQNTKKRPATYKHPLLKQCPKMNQEESTIRIWTVNLPSVNQQPWTAVIVINKPISVVHTSTNVLFINLVKSIKFTLTL